MRFKALLLVGLVWVGGCEIARVQDPVVGKLGADDPDTQMDFWHELAQRPMASNDDAAHAMLLFVDGKDGNPDYAGRVSALKGKGLLPSGFDAPADQAVQRGVLAYGLAKALKIEGGVTMRVFGNSERYATRELVDLEIFPLSSPNQTFSGTELVGIFGKAEDYQRGGGGEKVVGSLAMDAPEREGRRVTSPPEPAPPGSVIAPQIPPVETPASGSKP